MERIFGSTHNGVCWVVGSCATDAFQHMEDYEGGCPVAENWLVWCPGFNSRWLPAAFSLSSISPQNISTLSTDNILMCCLGNRIWYILHSKMWNKGFINIHNTQEQWTDLCIVISPGMVHLPIHKWNYQAIFTSYPLIRDIGREIKICMLQGAMNFIM